MKVLITGGAGFIGSRLATRILAEGQEVVLLDNFSPQIHGKNQDLSVGLRNRVRLIRGDVQDRNSMLDAIEGADVVVHLAAETGTGQSMYQIAHYSDVNIQGTVSLMDLLINEKSLNVKKVVVASSRAVYGEGRYLCGEHGVVHPSVRRVEMMTARKFEPECPVCGSPCTSIPTTEETPFSPASFYGLTKQVQEQTILLMAKAVGLDAIALRYQNVYGPGQSLLNPYTGILAIFTGLARKNEEIRVFEDGQESRDFVFIDDVVEATWRALNPTVHGTHALNVGSGQATTVRVVVDEIIKFFASSSNIRVTGEFRVGDIRHNVADISAAQSLLGFTPAVQFEDGIRQFLDWAAGEPDQGHGYQDSLAEMKQRGLMHG